MPLCHLQDEQPMPPRDGSNTDTTDPTLLLVEEIERSLSECKQTVNSTVDDHSWGSVAEEEEEEEDFRLVISME